MEPMLEVELSEDRVAVDPMVPSLFAVTRIHRETRDTFTLTLEPPEGNGGFNFTPGQFNMLYAFGVGEVPISISGDPGDGRLLTHTIRAVGSVTKAFCGLKKSDSLGVRGPFGCPWPVHQAGGKDIVIIGGGIGLAPLRPAVYHVLSHREKYGKVALLYGARTPNDILYLRELEQWRARFDVEVHITVDHATTAWRSNVGVVTRLIPRTSFDPSNTIAMICGPEVMMRFTVQELLKRGVESSDIYVSMERNMKCGLGFCGHCQYGPLFIWKDGPVFSFDRIRALFAVREI